ncbi:hypothetical protein [Kitasatospora sp. McL0602]|uniref:hypothetical protein n=1 Tax=Kitasatospora sp. McL0602 TaxID=3439530 RepID=UPI003F8A6E13
MSKWDAVAPGVIADYRAGLTWAEISRKHGIPQGSIAALLERHGAAPPPSLPVAEEEIVQLYVGERVPIRALAERFRISINTIRAALRRAGVQPRPPGPPLRKDRR